MKIDKNIIKILKSGGVGVLPTDTLYGLVGLALSKEAVERIYKIKKRGEAKPFIILISKMKDLKLFGVSEKEFSQKRPDLPKGSGLSFGRRSGLGRFWPGPVSIILDCPNLPKEMSYLQPLNNTLAFRCPDEKWLYSVLKKTGPLVAPSANPEGLPPAENIKQAQAYFDNSVDFYVDRGELKGQPSTIIKLDENGEVIILRK